MRERGEEGGKLVLEAVRRRLYVRETGIHNTPISRSAATLSGVHIAADAPRPGCILGRNYGGSLASPAPGASSVLPISHSGTFRLFSALRPG